MLSSHRLVVDRGVKFEARLGSQTKLARLAAELADFAAAEHVALIDLPTPGGKLVRHLEVCGRKMPFTATIKTAREVTQGLANEFGERARQLLAQLR